MVAGFLSFCVSTRCGDVFMASIMYVIQIKSYTGATDLTTEPFLVIFGDGPCMGRESGSFG